ncbi:unnamed protein product [Rhizophagus irregularis]|uniref:Uncharacterized protein n=1 Tax=Rhizophagus irregularis TaxID=588596 RepID=A0A915Z2R9_9GLOM|nr:unnamed protein product [Rhizophagus irregularis]CAB5203056.1 unnamed protein product [Rhizophagus irregularis]CAB5360274.1 unnamed protein product [Rhizophagus irregularis]CAB5391883.1 unnamed protein product [Rhizophagus irregularis]
MGLFARVSFRLNCSDNSTAFAFGGGNNGGRGHREVGRVGRGIKQKLEKFRYFYTKTQKIVIDSIELKSHQEMKLDLLENKTPKVSSKTRNSLPVFTGSGAKLTLLNA